jgi:hypothetical protein
MQMLLRSLQHIYNAVELFTAGALISSSRRDTTMLSLMKACLTPRKKKLTTADLFNEGPSDLSAAFFFEAMYSYWYDVIASKKDIRNFIYTKEEEK